MDANSNHVPHLPAAAPARTYHGRDSWLNFDAIRTMLGDCAYSTRALAERLGISSRQLQRLFRRQLGCSPREWLREQRLQQAHEMLRGPVSIKQVALTLAFRQESQFSRDFRMRFGYTPSALQRSHVGT